MGLRLRDVHPGCGGGVVVVGFESKSAGKKAGVRQGDRITGVDGELRFLALHGGFCLPPVDDRPRTVKSAGFFFLSLGVTMFCVAHG